jgi:hypothetical protein
MSVPQGPAPNVPIREAPTRTTTGRILFREDHIPGNTGMFNDGCGTASIDHDVMLNGRPTVRLDNQINLSNTPQYTVSVQSDATSSGVVLDTVTPQTLTGQVYAGSAFSTSNSIPAAGYLVVTGADGNSYIGKYGSFSFNSGTNVLTLSNCLLLPQVTDPSLVVPGTNVFGYAGLTPTCTMPTAWSDNYPLTSGYVNVSYNVSAAVKLGTTYTLTIGTHNYQVGQSIVVAGITGWSTNPNGTFTLTAVTTTTISYVKSGSPTGSYASGGTAAATGNTGVAGMILAGNPFPSPSSNPDTTGVVYKRRLIDDFSNTYGMESWVRWTQPSAASSNQAGGQAGQGEGCFTMANYNRDGSNYYCTRVMVQTNVPMVDNHPYSPAGVGPNGVTAVGASGGQSMDNGILWLCTSGSITGAYVQYWTPLGIISRQSFDQHTWDPRNDAWDRAGCWHYFKLITNFATQTMVSVQMNDLVFPLNLPMPSVASTGAKVMHFSMEWNQHHVLGISTDPRMFINIGPVVGTFE